MSTPWAPNSGIRQSCSMIYYSILFDHLLGLLKLLMPGGTSWILPAAPGSACERNFLMKESDRKALIALPVVVLIGALVAVAGSQGGATLGGIPVFAMAVAAAFLIQWLAFIPSFMA